MNKQLRRISAIAFGMAILSFSSLAHAQVILNVTQGALIAKGAGVDVSVQITCNQGLADSQVVFNGVSLSAQEKVLAVLI
ncbi:MAG: hypothetical protein ABIU05_20840 [Nitrospirales bacterium]